MTNPLSLSPTDFLAIRHSVLNGNSYSVDQIVKDTLKVEKYTPGRNIVPCFEGDLIQVRETGEVVLTHQNFVSLSQQRYRDLRERKIAASLQEVLDKVAAYQQKNPDQRIVLCFEPKHITTSETINETIRRAKEYGLTDIYFDSFFGDKLDLVQKANQALGTSYGRSLHLVGNVGKGKVVMVSAQQGYDILTIPHTMSFGNPEEPVIYGAVGSADILKRVAEDPLVCGAYIRLSEGAGIRGALKKLWNSATNSEGLRRVHLEKVGEAA